MFQNNEGSAFLPVITFVKLGSKKRIGRFGKSHVPERQASMQTSRLAVLCRYQKIRQIAIYLALNMREKKYKYGVQSVCNEDFYLSVYKPLNMRYI